MQDKDVQKRRKARQKKARRRRLKIFFIMFILIAIITLITMCFTTFFPIKRINVSGGKIYTKAEIIKASELTTNDNLFVVSQEKIEQKIRKKLPYVDSIKLKRNLPDALIITVDDAKEYSCFMVDNKYYIISQNGYVLKSQSEVPENVFEIVTSGVNCKIGNKIEYKNIAEQEMILKITTLLEKQNINIDKIDVSNILNINVMVENKFSVNFGNDEYLEQKIAHLSGMIESIGDRTGDINLSMWTPEKSQGSFVESAK